MKTIIAAIQKGGQGKTFLTCNFAFWLAKKGLKVCVIDLDTQGNSSYTLAKYTIKNLDSVRLYENPSHFDFHFVDGDFEKDLKIKIFCASPKLADFEKLNGTEWQNVVLNFSINIQRLSKHFDFCLIDTAPSLSNVLTSSFLIGDFFFTPIELETYSLQGVEKILTVAHHLKKSNPKLHFLGILPNKVDVRKPRQKESLQKLKIQFGDKVIPYAISLRDSFAQALNEQIPIWQVKKTAARKATKEFDNVAQYILQSVENF